MGTVYEAYDRALGREVALKILVARYRGRPEREARFVQEAELGRRALGVRGVVQYVGHGRLHVLQGCPCIVHERVRGRFYNPTLDGAMAPRRVAMYARLLAEAVRGLHRLGIVHRDVTLRNVLFEDAELVLLDLSHATMARPEADGRLTGVLEIPGTPGSMSPEQARGELAEPGMDVYAFGVVLYQLLTGSRPFPGLDRARLIAMQAADALRMPAIEDPQVPEALRRLVADCTAPRAARIDMNAVVRRLDEVLSAMVVPLPVESTQVVSRATPVELRVVPKASVLADGAREAGDITRADLLRKAVPLPFVKRARWWGRMGNRWTWTTTAKFAGPGGLATNGTAKQPSGQPAGRGAECATCFNVALANLSGSSGVEGRIRSAAGTPVKARASV
jgi:serine/threonine-protein kinase